jgi:hypothetical protein
VFLIGEDNEAGWATTENKLDIIYCRYAQGTRKSAARNILNVS